MILQKYGVFLALFAAPGCKFMHSETQVEAVDSSGYSVTPGKKCDDSLASRPLEAAKFVYQQKCLSYQDKQGDLSLAYVLQVLPARLIARMTGQTPPTVPGVKERNSPEVLNAFPFDVNPHISTEEQFKPNAGQIYQLQLPGYEQFRDLNSRERIIGEVNPFDAKRFVQMMLGVMHKTGIAPFMGPVHQFSISAEEIAKYVPPNGDGKREDPVASISRLSSAEGVDKKSFSKLFACLATGMCSRYLYTGGERALLEYIASQPDGSIQPADLFEKSYRMFNGDVYLSLLTIENALSRWWTDADRANLTSTRKLANITNAYYGRDDRYHAWYHLFGIMLFGLTEGSVAPAVADIEALGRLVLDHFSSADKVVGKQGILANTMGAKIGLELRSMMNTLSVSKDVVAMAKNYDLNFPADVQKVLDPSYYLKLDEDFRDRIKMTTSSEIRSSTSAPDVATVRSRDLLLASVQPNKDLHGCVIEIFPACRQGCVRDSTKLMRQEFVTLANNWYSIAVDPQWEGQTYTMAGARAIVSKCKGFENQALVAETDRVVN